MRMSPRRIRASSIATSLPTAALVHWQRLVLNDLALQAHSGLMSMTGEAGGGPVRSGTSVVDLHGGLSMACAIMAALFHRARTGEGQRVETSLLLSSAHLMGYFYTEYWLDGTVHRPMGTRELSYCAEPGFPDGGWRDRHHREHRRRLALLCRSARSGAPGPARLPAGSRSTAEPQEAGRNFELRHR